MDVPLLLVGIIATTCFAVGFFICLILVHSGGLEQSMEAERSRLLNERAWGIIANVSNGDWDQQSPEWRDCAMCWERDWSRGGR